MAKQQRITIGSNVLFWQDGNFDCFAVDRTVQGTQSKSSKGFKTDGTPKPANELVGSTGSYTSVPITDDDARVMVHYIRPMAHKTAVAATRRARAVSELQEEDDASSAAGLGITLAQLKELATIEGCSVAEVLKRLA